MKSDPKILAFYGAFNPPTKAHIDLAKYAMEQVGYKHVVFVPSQSKYIKDDQQKDWAFSDDQRIDMLETIADNNNWMWINYNDIEANKQPRTYESLCYLKLSGYQPKLLIGFDTLLMFEKHWKNVDKIAKEFGIICLYRNQNVSLDVLEKDPYLKELAPYIQIIKYPENKYENISSSEVRKVLNEMYALQSKLVKMLPSEIIPNIFQYWRN